MTRPRRSLYRSRLYPDNRFDIPVQVVRIGSQILVGPAVRGCSRRSP